MTDFHNPFDLVDHQLLLKKLRIYQFSDMSLSWFKSYPSHRTQQEVTNDMGNFYLQYQYILLIFSDKAMSLK